MKSEEINAMLSCVLETFKKHKNAEPFSNYVELNSRYNTLIEEFTNSLNENMERIGQTYGPEVEKLAKSLKENGDLDEEIYNRVLAEELKRDVSKETELLERFTKCHKEILNVKISIIEYIKCKNINENTKKFVLFTLNEHRENCEAIIEILKNMVEKHYN